MSKQIRLDDPTYEQLDRERRKGETFDAVVARLLATVRQVRQANAVYEGERLEFEPARREV